MTTTTSLHDFLVSITTVLAVPHQPRFPTNNALAISDALLQAGSCQCVNCLTTVADLFKRFDANYLRCCLLFKAYHLAFPADDLPELPTDQILTQYSNLTDMLAKIAVDDPQHPHYAAVQNFWEFNLDYLAAFNHMEQWLIAEMNQLQTTEQHYVNLQPQDQSHGRHQESRSRGLGLSVGLQQPRRDQ